MLDRLADLSAEYTIFGLEAFVWIKTLLFAALLAGGFLLVRRFLVWRFRKLSSRTANRIDDVLLEILQRVRAYFLVALAVFVGAILAGMPDLPGRGDPLSVIEAVTFVAFLFQLVAWGNRLITMWLTHYKEVKLEQDAAAVTTMQAVGFIGRIVLWAVVLLLALDNFGFDVTALVAGLGVGGIAIALALQNILGDLFASLSIVLDKPFVVGDFLIVGDFLGTVEYVGLKTTRVRSLSGEQIVFSNSDLLGSRIRNYKRMFERRIVFQVGVVYQTKPEHLEAIPQMIREAVEAQEPVRFDRAHFKNFGDFSLNFETVYYVLVPEYNVYMDVQQAINLALYRRFREAGIAFAYPTQSLFVEALPGGSDGQTEQRATIPGGTAPTGAAPTA